jgi:fermentation-respiration switch protein FrsA (DUF1100 family)
VITALALVVGALVLATAGLWLAQRHLIYLPDHELAPPQEDLTVRTTATEDGIVHQVWLVPAEDEPMARVMVFNGNAGDKADRMTLARNLAAYGMEVALFDYRGYGETEGIPSEEGLLDDAEAVAEVASESGLPVVFLGESLGAGVATGLATRVLPEALVLRSPFTSMADMARAHYPLLPPFLLRDRYRVEEQIASLEIPLLVVMGSSDSIVPPTQSRRVFEAAPGPKELVIMEGLDHNDAGLSSSLELAEEVRAFLGRVGVLSP